MTQETYLGDGLYASYDGEYIKLRALRIGGDHECYLDGPTFFNFAHWVNDVLQPNDAFLKQLSIKLKEFVPKDE